MFCVFREPRFGMQFRCCFDKRKQNPSRSSHDSSARITIMKLVLWVISVAQANTSYSFMMTKFSQIKSWILSGGFVWMMKLSRVQGSFRFEMKLLDSVQGSWVDEDLKYCDFLLWKWMSVNRKLCWFCLLIDIVCFRPALLTPLPL